MWAVWSTYYTVPIMHLGNTYSFRKSQRADSSLECSQTDDLQSRQTDAVPDTNVRLQRLETKVTTDCDKLICPFNLHHFTVEPSKDVEKSKTCLFSLVCTVVTLLTRPSLSTPAICPVAIRILSGWIAKLRDRDRDMTSHTSSHTSQ